MLKDTTPIGDVLNAIRADNPDFFDPPAEAPAPPAGRGEDRPYRADLDPATWGLPRLLEEAIHRIWMDTEHWRCLTLQSEAMAAAIRNPTPKTIFQVGFVASQDGIRATQQAVRLYPILMGAFDPQAPPTTDMVREWCARAMRIAGLVPISAREHADLHRRLIAANAVIRPKRARKAKV